jgi:hypothetical protein
MLMRELMAGFTVVPERSSVAADTCWSSEARISRDVIGDIAFVSFTFGSGGAKEARILFAMESLNMASLFCSCRW